MTGTVVIDVFNRLVDGTDHFDCEHQIEIFRVVVVLRGEFRRRREIFAELLVTAQFDAAPAHRFEEERHEPCRRVPVNEQRLQRVAGARALTFGVFDDLRGLFEIAFGVDVEVADAFVMLQHRHCGLRADQTDEPFAAAGDDQVEITVEFEQQIDCLVVGPRHELHGAVGQIAGHGGAIEDAGKCDVGVECFAPAAQDDGVSGLEADAGGVDGHVGPRFINDADHADRDGNFGDFESVRPRRLRQDPPDRIMLGGDYAQPVGHLLDPAVIEGEAVDHGGGKPFGAGGFEVESVCLADGVGGSFDFERHAFETGVFRFGRQDGKGA